MGWSFRSDDYSSLRPIASTLLVASASDAENVQSQLTTEQLLALGFLVGCTFAPDLKTFAGLYLASYT